jgi:hypothetical protein
MVVAFLEVRQPNHWHLLSSGDAQEYLRLSNDFHGFSGKSRKGTRSDTFQYCLGKIRQFVDHNEHDSWKRSLVCGVFFLPDSLALNI